MILAFIRKLFSSDYEKGTKPPLYFWYPTGTSAEDKKLLFKLDSTILVYGCLSFWVKYLDSANLTNAYVTGMREDLGLLKNQLTLMGTLFNVGGLVFQIPSNLLITRISPRWWLPGCELAWGLLTLGMYKVRSASAIYGIRFCVGLLEGSCFVGMHWIFGTWYTKRELGKRAAIFACCAYAGSMFSGFLQAAVQKTLNGHGGLQGWRWLFIIDAIITFVVAIFGFIMFPGTPEKCSAWYLSESEKKRCVERLREDGKGHELDIFSMSLFKRVLGSWQLWLLLPVWCFWSNTLGKYIGTVMTLWLKAHSQFSVYQVNNYPTIVGGTNIASILIAAWATDLTGRRLGVVYVCLGIQIIGTIIVRTYDVSIAGMFIGFIMGANDGPTSPLVLSWANILCYGDAQQRALTLAIMNSCAGATSTLVNQFGYPVLTGPRFSKGVTISLVSVILELIGLSTIRWVEIKTEPSRREAKLAAMAEVGLILPGTYEHGSVKAPSEKDAEIDVKVQEYDNSVKAGPTPSTAM